MNKNEELKIVYRNYGIADAFPDGVIELNKHLRKQKHDKLRKSLIEHELKHSRNARLNKHDFVHDLTTMNQISQWEMVKFMSRHPLTLVQFAPIYYTKKRGFIIDQNLIVIYFILLVLVSGAIVLGKAI